MRGTVFMLLVLVCFGAGVLPCYAQADLPIDPQTNTVVYRQTYQLSASLTDDDINNLLSGWFKENPAKLSSKNENLVAESFNSKNRDIVDAAFDNSQPLQSLDPVAKKATGRGIIKYYGGGNTCIRLLYMEYYIELEVEGHQLTATISGIKYHHLNPRTYTQQVIYNWMGGKPCDATNGVEHLVAQKPYYKEFDTLCEFLNANMNRLFKDLTSYLKTNSALAVKGQS